MKKYNLQLFADGGNGQEQMNTVQSQSNSSVQPSSPVQQPVQIDYERIAGLISGKQAAAEDTVLKSYFKEQGLTREEMQSAIAAFKEQKKASEPDVAALSRQLDKAQAEARSMMLQYEGLKAGLEMGLAAKAVPHILKMADTSSAIKEDGTVDTEKLKESINAVLEDIPELKLHTEEEGRKEGVPDHRN